MGMVIGIISFSLFWIYSFCDGQPYLLLANRKDVRLIDASNPNNSTIVVSHREDAAAVDFIFDIGVVYWTDISLELIERTYLSSSDNAISIISSGIVSPDGLACDWVTRKIYWTDSGTNRIELSNLDGSHRKVLFWTQLDQPRAITLNPLNGYVYWTDWGESPKIERAGMDGNSQLREVLINKDVFWPNGLTIDYEDSKLYWTDAKLHYIHSCNLDGSDRRVVIHDEDDLPYPFSVTLFEDTLYWTDWSTHSIHSCNKYTASDQAVIIDDIFSPLNVHVFNSGRQPSCANPCRQNNGGCSHLCLLSPHQPFYSCACPTGIRLRNDSATCAHGAERILFLARRLDLRRISMDTTDHTAVILPLSNIRHAIAIDYDPEEGYVYWSDDEVRAIQRSRLDGSEQEIVVTTEIDQPDGIALDLVARNLYWTDTGLNRIEVTRLSSSARKVLITIGLDEPRAICLDTASGYMYWTDWGRIARIERANLDGTERVALIDTGLIWPNGLAVDTATRQLFWGDAKTDRIECSDLYGQQRRVLVEHSLPHVFGFSLMGDYIYWTDWQRRSIERVNKSTGGEREKIVDQLPDLMGLKAIDMSRHKGSNPCGIKNGGCSHLCLYCPPPKGPVCACPIGMELTGDGRTCIVPDAFLLFSSHASINRISMEISRYNQPTPIQSIPEPVVIDFHLMDSRVYMTGSQTISRSFMNASTLQHLVEFGLKTVKGLAVDWIASNLYWTDMGKKRIEVARLDGSSRKVLVWRDLDTPRAIALDPPSGHMYWTTDGVRSQLTRANLDGSQHRPVVVDIGTVQDLTIDYTARRLYWSNVDIGSIQSCDMLGTNRRFLSHALHPVGVTQYEDFLYWTDAVSRSIERAEKDTGSGHIVIQDDVNLPMDITVVHASRQAGQNACGANNGHCSHLCLAHSLDQKDNRTHHCACPTHYLLNSDGRSCSAPDAYLLLSQKSEISRLVVDFDRYENDDGDIIDNPEVTLPIHGMKNIKALAYDPVGQHIYWIEGRQRVIKRSHDNGSDLAIFLNSGSRTVQPFDIAVDPYSRTLYWSCSINNVINATRLDMTPIGVALQGVSNFRPRSIALYPERGYIFYTNMVTSPRIESARMDGSERSELFIKQLVHPWCLTIDKQTNKLYWADAHLNRIEMSDLTGGNRRVLVDGRMADVRGLAVNGRYLYWLDRQQRLVERCNKKTGAKRLWVRGQADRLSDLIAVKHSLDVSDHPCSVDNGGCSHFCLAAAGSLTSRCSCPHNLVLRQDGIHCTDPPTCPTDHFTCRSGEVSCIPLVWRCDSLSECEDDSDELDCPPCGTGRFHCGSGECIPNSERCDGSPGDCRDGSDEKGCCVEGDTLCSDADCQGANTCLLMGADKCKGGDCMFDVGAESPPHHAIHYAAPVVIGSIFFVAIVVAILFCRHRLRQRPLVDDDMLSKKPLNPQLLSDPPVSSSSSRFYVQRAAGAGHMRSLSSTSFSLGDCSSTSGITQFYARCHVTGASSSTSTGTNYPQPLNPPPSPVTEYSGQTVKHGGNVIPDLLSPSLSSIRSNCRRHGGSQFRSSRRHHPHQIPPPPTTPCSTDVCDEGESCHSKRFQYYVNSSLIELSYDSDPDPPPPTPRLYFSDDFSGPPSPSTDRSYFNPYPPPPSPV